MVGLGPSQTGVAGGPTPLGLGARGGATATEVKVMHAHHLKGKDLLIGCVGLGRGRESGSELALQGTHRFRQAFLSTATMLRSCTWGSRLSTRLGCQSYVEYRRRTGDRSVQAQHFRENWHA
eukprot:350554-Chlamydomonas_euryale.AAC.6